MASFTRAPAYNDDQLRLSSVEGQRKFMLDRQQDLAKQYKDEAPKTIEEQYNVNAAPLKRQYSQARSNLVGDLNRRGMLKSGKAETSKAQLAGDEYGALMGARSKAVQDVGNRQLALETDPLQSYANIQEQNQSFGSQLNNIESQRQNFLNQLQGQSMGYLGSGLGRGLSNVGGDKGFFYRGY